MRVYFGPCEYQRDFVFLLPWKSADIYDFSHEAEGVGLIMPVVKVEQVEVVLVKPQA